MLPSRMSMQRPIRSSSSEANNTKKQHPFRKRTGRGAFLLRKRGSGGEVAVIAAHDACIDVIEDLHAVIVGNGPAAVQVDRAHNGVVVLAREVVVAFVSECNVNVSDINIAVAVCIALHGRTDDIRNIEGLVVGGALQLAVLRAGEGHAVLDAVIDDLAGVDGVGFIVDAGDEDRVLRTVAGQDDLVTEADDSGAVCIAAGQLHEDRVLAAEVRAGKRSCKCLCAGQRAALRGAADVRGGGMHGTVRGRMPRIQPAGD